MPSVKVKGMSCGHCVSAVTAALKTIRGVNDIEVNLHEGTASWKDTLTQDPVSKDKIIAIIQSIGFDAE